MSRECRSKRDSKEEKKEEKQHFQHNVKKLEGPAEASNLTEPVLTENYSAISAAVTREVVLVKAIHTFIAINLNKAHHVVTALIDNGSEVNLISQRCVKELNSPRPTNSSHIGLTTINRQLMQTYGVYYLNIEVVDALGHTRYFQEGFIASNNNEPIILGMLFLKCANPNIDYSQSTFEWRTYDAQAALETVQRVQVVEPKV